MELIIKVELGEATRSFISQTVAQMIKGGVTASTEDEKPKKELKKQESEKEEEEDEKPTAKIPAKTASLPTKPAVKAKPTIDEQVAAFIDMADEEEQLEAIKNEILRHTKKGKSADIKFILGNFDVARASDLAPDDYAAFYTAVLRYGAGEDLEDIFAEA